MTPFQQHVKEEHRQRVFENRVLRRIFGPKRDGVMGGWRKLHNEVGGTCGMNGGEEERV
jgi:hypothetical protein